MYARVATFEGGEAEGVRQVIARIDAEFEGGRPPGVPTVGGMILHDAAAGKVLAITLFETEGDLRAGDAALSSMDPPTAGGMGRRTSVETFEVALSINP